MELVGKISPARDISDVDGASNGGNVEYAPVPDGREELYAEFPMVELDGIIPPKFGQDAPDDALIGGGNVEYVSGPKLDGIVRSVLLLEPGICS